MDTLSELGIKYKTDKIGKHNYLPVYYDLLKRRRNKIKKILEIGVGEGNGLRMFRDFLPNALIYGADNDAKRIFVDPPIQVFKCDQSHEPDLINLLNLTGCDLDLVIDDGSHRPQDQILTCQIVFNAVKKGAIYVIEDVADRSIFTELPKGRYGEIKEVGKRYDDCLIIMKK